MLPPDLAAALDRATWPDAAEARGLLTRGVRGDTRAALVRWAFDAARSSDGAAPTQAAWAALLRRLTRTEGTPITLWYRRDGEGRSLTHLRFEARGVRRPTAGVIPWSERAARLPQLPALLDVARDYVRHAIYAYASEEVRAVEEAMTARGLDAPSLLGADGRAWFQSCPQFGTPACTYGDAAPRDSCRYCRGTGYLARRAPDVLSLLSLYAHGEAMQRAEAVAREMIGRTGVRIDRVVWYAVSAQDMAHYRRRGGIHRWAPVTVAVEVEPFTLLAVSGRDAIMAVERL